MKDVKHVKHVTEEKTPEKLYLVALHKYSSNQFNFTVREFDVSKETPKKIKANEIDTNGEIYNEIEVLKRKLNLVTTNFKEDSLEVVAYKSYTTDFDSIDVLKKQMIQLVENRIKEDKKMILETEKALEEFKKNI